MQLQCAGQPVLIDSVLSTLLTSLNDPAALVRRLSLKGLANISYLDADQVFTILDSPTEPNTVLVNREGINTVFLNRSL